MARLVPAVFSVLDPYLVQGIHDMSAEDLHASIESYRAYLSKSLSDLVTF